MASSSMVSPLCTWLVAACMSVTCGKDQSQSSFLRSSAFASSSKRHGRWARTRRRALLSQCSGRGNGSTKNQDGSMISAFYGFGIQGLMASWLTFEPCNDYYSSKNCSLFGQNRSFSYFFGPKILPNRKQRRLNGGAACSGEAMAVAPQPTREITTKKETSYGPKTSCCDRDGSGNSTWT